MLPAGGTLQIFIVVHSMMFFQLSQGEWKYLRFLFLRSIWLKLAHFFDSSACTSRKNRYLVRELQYNSSLGSVENRILGRAVLTKCVDGVVLVKMTGSTSVVCIDSAW